MRFRAGSGAAHSRTRSGGSTHCSAGCHCCGVATAVPAPAKSKVLRMAITQNQATSFDIASTGSGSVPIDTMMYEWLVRYKGGTADVEPWLAKSWEMSADNTTATFKLQEGVQWQKGYGEFTADDVKFTIDRMINEKLPEAENWKNLDHVEVVDKYTVKIVMKSPSPTLFTLSLPFQAGMIMCKKAVEDLGAKAFNETPVGTGPYEIVSYDPQQGVRFKKYDKYWGTRALDVDEVLWAFPKDPLTAMQAGDIDMVATAQMGTLADAAKVADAVPASRLTRYWWISLPVNNAILKDINARKAIRAALDIDPIVEASSLGMGVRGYAMVPPGIPGYWADAPQYKQDVAQAKQFMKDAGYPDGFSVPFLAMSSPRIRASSSSASSLRRLASSWMSHRWTATPGGHLPPRVSTCCSFRIRPSLTGATRCNTSSPTSSGTP